MLRLFASYTSGSPAIRVLSTPYSNRNSYIITNLGWSEEEEEYLNEGKYIPNSIHTYKRGIKFV